MMVSILGTWRQSAAKLGKARSLARTHLVSKVRLYFTAWSWYSSAMHVLRVRERVFHSYNPTLSLPAAATATDDDDDDDVPALSLHTLTHPPPIPPLPLLLHTHDGLAAKRKQMVEDDKKYRAAAAALFTHRVPAIFLAWREYVTIARATRLARRHYYKVLTAKTLKLWHTRLLARRLTRANAEWQARWGPRAKDSAALSKPFSSRLSEAEIDARAAREIAERRAEHERVMERLRLQMTETAAQIRVVKQTARRVERAVKERMEARDAAHAEVGVLLDKILN